MAALPRRRIIEPPFQVESERYQTCQCADWLCGLVGRVGAIKHVPTNGLTWHRSQTCIFRPG
jgi:hypothetical protein